MCGQIDSFTLNGLRNSKFFFSLSSLALQVLLILRDITFNTVAHYKLTTRFFQ